MHPDPGLEHVGDDQPDDEGQGGHDLEIEERLEADAADRPQVAHAADAGDDSGEDDRTDEHLDQLDEGVAQRLEGGPEFRLEVAEQNARHDAEQHLTVETGDESFHRGSAPVSGTTPVSRETASSTAAATSVHLRVNFW